MGVCQNRWVSFGTDGCLSVLMGVCLSDGCLPKTKTNTYYMYITIPLYWLNYLVNQASSGVQVHVCPLKLFLLIKSHWSHWYSKHVLYNYMYTWLLQFCIQLHAVKCQLTKSCVLLRRSLSLTGCHWSKLKDLSILDAFCLLAKSWRHVKGKMMVNCFWKRGFMKPLPEDSNGSQDVK